MMGRQRDDQAQVFYSFRRAERVPASHLLRKINVLISAALADVHREMVAFYSHTGRPSIDPELKRRMLISGGTDGPSSRDAEMLGVHECLNFHFQELCGLDRADKRFGANWSLRRSSTRSFGATAAFSSEGSNHDQYPCKDCASNTRSGRIGLCFGRHSIWLHQRRTRLPLVDGQLLRGKGMLESRR